MSRNDYRFNANRENIPGFEQTMIRAMNRVRESFRSWLQEGKKEDGSKKSRSNPDNAA